jgi:hypothetical protein
MPTVEQLGPRHAPARLSPSSMWSMPTRRRRPWMGTRPLSPGPSRRGHRRSGERRQIPWHVQMDLCSDTVCTSCSRGPFRGRTPAPLPAAYITHDTARGTRSGPRIFCRLGSGSTLHGHVVHQSALEPANGRDVNVMVQQNPSRMWLCRRARFQAARARPSLRWSDAPNITPRS